VSDVPRKEKKRYKYRGSIKMTSRTGRAIIHLKINTVGHQHEKYLFHNILALFLLEGGVARGVV